MSPAVHAFIVAFIILNVIIGMVTYVTLLERKFAARMQSRIGPHRVGPHGLLQPIADALPFSFTALVPVVLTGSLRLSDIAAAQQGLLGWFVFYPVIGQLAFVAYVVTTLAAENRVPFDILEAESELIAGFRVEYSGMKFALIQLGEYAHMIGTSFLGALLFLGAWSGPGPAWMGPIWFLLKAMFVFLLVTWVRWSFVRIRVDQILAISWKLLLPATLVLLLATGFVVAVRGAGGG